MITLELKVSRNNGQAAITAVFFLLMVSLVIGSAYASLANRAIQSSRTFARSVESYAASESGIEDVLLRSSRGVQVDAAEVLAVGPVTVTTVTTSSWQDREITASGDLSSIVRKTRVGITLGSVGLQFVYGVQVGDGGVEMEENSEIIGNVSSNGDIIGHNGAKISGDVIVSGNIVESNQARSTVCNQDQVVGNTDPQIDFAQSFTAPSSEPLVKVSLYIKKVGNPADRIVRIVTDSFGSPSQMSLASVTLSSGLVTENYGWVDVIFSSPPVLTAGNTYWVVFDATQNNTKYWIWCSDSNNGYGNGVGKYKQDWDSGGAWTQITGDLNFKTYFGSGIHTLNKVIVAGTAWANNIVNSSICGDAYYQGIDSSSLAFLNNPSSPICSQPLTGGTAFPDSADQPPSNMPVSQANIDQWKNDAQAGGQMIGDYNVTNDVSLGPKEITGSLVMVDNNKTLTVTGTLYVRGNIDIANGSAVHCDPAYGENSCLVIADGWIHVANNGQFLGSGTPGSFTMLLTTLACTGSSGVGCGHHGGAIDAHNNATGVIFYASNGMINLHNGVSLTEVTAYKLRMENNAVITYESGLANAKFSSGPTGGFSVKDWREVE